MNFCKLGVPLENGRDRRRPQGTCWLQEDCETPMKSGHEKKQMQQLENIFPSIYSRARVVFVPLCKILIRNPVNYNSSPISEKDNFGWEQMSNQLLGFSWSWRLEFSSVQMQRPCNIATLPMGLDWLLTQCYAITLVY